MDQYLPPLVAVTVGVVIIFLCFTLRIPFFLVGFLSICMVIYAFQDHVVQFGNQYSTVTAPTFFKENASIFITIIVIILSLGFLLFRFGPRTITNNEQTSYYSRRPEKSSGVFSGLYKMFQNPQSTPSHLSRRYNMYDYGRSSAYNDV
jgi:hypothetical protein